MEAALTFAKRIIELRKKNGYSQYKAAEILGIPRSTLSGYETQGKQPDLDLLGKMSEMYGVSLDYLLGYAELPNPNRRVIATDERSILSAVDKLPDDSKKIAAALYDDFFVLVHDVLTSGDKGYLSVYAELFSALRSGRNEVKKSTDDLGNAFDPIALASLMEKQTELKAKVSAALDALNQADMAAAAGKNTSVYAKSKAT